MNPLAVRYDVNRQVVSPKFLDLYLTTGVDGSKPKEIFEAIDNTLERCMKYLGIIVLLLVLIIQTATLVLKIPSNQGSHK